MTCNRCARHYPPSREAHDHAPTCAECGRTLAPGELHAKRVGWAGCLVLTLDVRADQTVRGTWVALPPRQWQREPTPAEAL